MAKLPGAPDLGPSPRADVVGYDQSAITRTGAAAEGGVQQLAKGVTNLGEGEASLAIDENRWDYAKAHSDFLTNKTDLDNRTGKDTNAGADDSGQTLPQRYNTNIAAVQSNAADLIRDPAMRNRFLTETRPQVEQGVAAANNHAYSLQNQNDIAYVDQLGEKQIDQIVTAKDDQTRSQLIDTHNQLVDGLVAKGAITPVQAVDYKKKWAVQLSEADVRARVDRGDFSVLQDLRDSRGTTPDPNNAPSPSFDNTQFPKAGDRSDAVNAINKTASNLGIAPRDLTAAISYETSGKFDPDIMGGKGGNYQGLIQFGPAERKQYGVTKGMSFSDQMGAVENYLRDRGVKPGMGLPEIYSIINAGSLDKNGQPRWNASDGNGTVRTHVAGIQQNHMPMADQFLAPTAQPDQPAPVKVASADSGTATDAAPDGSVPAPKGKQNIYSILPPERREAMIEFAKNQQQRALVKDLSGFKQQVDDNQAQFDRTGDGPEIPSESFTGKLGPDLGQQAYQQYKLNIQTSRDTAKLATMNPGEQDQLIRSYTPTAGDGYADQARRQDMLVQARDRLEKQKTDDPAGFAVQRLPATGEAYKGLLQKLSDPTSNEADRQAAAKNYANTSALEQNRIGIAPDQQKIVPQDYIDNFNKTIGSAAASDDPQKRIGLVGQIQREAAMWGDSWPKVMQQLAPTSQPIVRAIAAGADPAAMTRLLSLGKDEAPAKLLKEQNDTKSADLDKALNTEMQPFLSSLVGRQKDRDYTGYFNLAQQLGALYVRDGKSASDAASSAFADLLGKRYDFRDTYRIPKSAGVSPDDVQAGVVAATQAMRAGATPQTNFETATKELGLNPEEQALYQRHVSNLYGAGGVDNDGSDPNLPAGTRSTLYQTSFERDGKTYNVPTVWDGKILKPDAAIKRAEAEGLEKFPAYGSQQEAEDRYGQMHDYMEKDTNQFQQDQKTNPIANIKPAINDVGQSDNRADSLRKFGRDGKFVTSPDNNGLNLAVGDKFVRTNDGQPFFLSWSQLASLGKTPAERKRVAADAAFNSSQTP